MTLRDTDTCASLTRESFGIRSEPQRTPDAGKTMGEPDDFEDSDYDDDEPECPRCHGEGMDPWNDYLLPCPECGGEHRL